MTFDLALHGIYPAVITPFEPVEGGVDTEALAHHIARLLDAGVHGLIVGGTTGEFTTLTVDERKELHEAAVRAAGHRVPVIVQTGALSTREAIDLTQHAEAIGADGVMVVAPFYEGLTFAESKQYYSDVAESSRLPVMIYHYPGATRLEVSMEELAELAKIPHVESLKFSADDSDFFFRARDEFEGKLQLINGVDTEMVDSVTRGVEAIVLGTSNVIPEIAVALFNEFNADPNSVVGTQLWEQTRPLLEYIERGEYVQKVKASLQISGYDSGAVRRPLLPLGDSVQRELASLVDALPVIQGKA